MKRLDLQTGKNSIEVDGSNWLSGTYLYVIIADGKKVSSNKMLIQK